MRFLTMVLSVVIASVLATNASAADEKKKDGKRGPRMSVEERFKQLDKDSDGKVTKDEFVAGSERMGKERAEKTFTAWDTNKDGSLSLDEYKKGWEELRKTFGDRKKGEKKE